MERIEIQTESNVPIHYQVASIAERIVAHLLDWLFIGAYMIIMRLVVGNASNNQGWVYILLFMVPLLYDLAFEWMLKGQSPGKIIMRIRVVGRFGEPPSIPAVIIRWAFRPFENVLFMGLPSILAIILEGKGRRLGDMVAGTMVIREQRAIAKAPSALPDDYRVSFPEVSRLTENDIAIIREAFEFYQKNRWSENSFTIGLKTMSAIQKKMGIHVDMKPYDFLQVVINDYTCINK